jgi:hypothetical protein
MKTYTLINRPQAESDAQSMFEPCRIEGIPTNLTFREASVLCSKVRSNGHDVCVFNTKAA